LLEKTQENPRAHRVLQSVAGGGRSKAAGFADGLADLS